MVFLDDVAALATIAPRPTFGITPGDTISPGHGDTNPNGLSEALQGVASFLVNIGGYIGLVLGVGLVVHAIVRAGKMLAAEAGRSQDSWVKIAIEGIAGALLSITSGYSTIRKLLASTAGDINNKIGGSGSGSGGGGVTA